VTVGETLGELLAHPARTVIARWNWKSALLSAAIRGAIFFTTNLTAGLGAAGRALMVDAAFRIPLVGLYAAVIQAFAGAEPAWVATGAVAVIVPALAHGFEFAVHRTAGTPALYTSIAVSVGFSVVSTVFQLFAMRRGVLIVGPSSSSFRDDVRRLPVVMGVFVLALPAAALRLARPARPHR
jgi:hypothetical protein